MMSQKNPNHLSQTFRKDNGSVVGVMKDGWLEKPVNPAIHKPQRPSGWATDISPSMMFDKYSMMSSLINPL